MAHLVPWLTVFFWLSMALLNYQVSRGYLWKMMLFHSKLSDYQWCHEAKNVVVQDEERSACNAGCKTSLFILFKGVYSLLENLGINHYSWILNPCQGTLSRVLGLTVGFEGYPHHDRIWCESNCQALGKLRPFHWQKNESPKSAVRSSCSLPSGKHSYWNWP